jgi:hypothetical protein
MKNLRIERLANGFYRIYDYSTKSASLYNENGSYRSGDFRQPATIVSQLIATLQ